MSYSTSVSNQTSCEFKVINSQKRRDHSLSACKLSLVQKFIHKSYLVSQHMILYILSSYSPSSFFLSLQIKQKEFSLPYLIQQTHQQMNYFLLNYIHPYLPTPHQL
ncbi:hypothetical protein HMI55_005287 [Coelomomyces lativittatus]|nr:hypothetical protein HMI56_005521 [Coelomomyces lativittatus]KAJ1497803.1 hypothetical protein HMI55_005287 [Coelomomyces lativittatus]